MEDNERRKRIGRQLQRLRKEAGYKSAAAFAKSLGIKTGTYTSYEQGEAAFTIERAWEMADKLNCSLDELLGRDYSHDNYAVTSDERRLLSSYRLMDSQHREQLTNLAGSLVIASEKDSPGNGSDVRRTGISLELR